MHHRNVLPFPRQAIVFTCLQYKSFENSVAKGEIARNEQFLLFRQCFLPFYRTFYHFHQNLNCRLKTLSVRKILKCDVWERIKSPFLPGYGSIIFRSVLNDLISVHVIHYYIFKHLIYN